MDKAHKEAQWKQFNELMDSMGLDYPSKTRLIAQMREKFNGNVNDMIASVREANNNNLRARLKQNPMSEAVDARLSAEQGVQAPHPITEAVDRRLNGQMPQEAPRTWTPLKDIRVQPQASPKPSRLQEIQQTANQTRQAQAAQTMRSKVPEVPAEFQRPNFPPTERPAIYGGESIADRVIGRSAAIGDRVAEKFGNGVGMGIAKRGIGKALPIIGDLLMPSAEINGGEMYPVDESGMYRSATGGALPPEYQSHNDEIARQANRMQVESHRRTSGQPNTINERNYIDNPITPITIPQQQQTNISRYLSAPSQQQQEPQSFAQQLSSQEPHQQQGEPQSIAQSIKNEVPTSDPSTFDHYMKLYGSKEKAKMALEGLNY